MPQSNEHSNNFYSSDQSAGSSQVFHEPSSQRQVDQTLSPSAEIVSDNTSASLVFSPTIANRAQHSTSPPLTTIHCGHDVSSDFGPSKKQGTSSPHHQHPNCDITASGISTPAYLYWNDGSSTSGLGEPPASLSEPHPSETYTDLTLSPWRLCHSEVADSSISSLPAFAGLSPLHSSSSFYHNSKKQLPQDPQTQAQSWLQQNSQSTCSMSSSAPTKDLREAALKKLEVAFNADPTMTGLSLSKIDKHAKSKYLAEVAQDHTLLPKYGAMGPSLNYILGLDEYGDTAKHKPHKTHLLHGRTRYNLPTSTTSPPSKASTPQNELLSPGQLHPKASNQTPLVISFGDVSETKSTIAEGMAEISYQPSTIHIENQPSSTLNTGTAFHRLPMSSLDFHRILRSLPPTFPLGTYPVSSAPNELESSNAAPTPYNGSGLPFLSSSQLSKDSSKSTQGSSVKCDAVPLNSQPKISLEQTTTHLPPSKLPITENRSHRYANMQSHGDEFLWKLFLPQPRVIPVSSAPISFTNNKLILPNQSRPSSEPQLSLSPPSFNSNDLSPSHPKIKEETSCVAAPSTATSPVAGCTQTTQETSQERLLIAVRRLPDRIYARLKKDDASTCEYELRKRNFRFVLDTLLLASNDGDEHITQGVDLTLNDIDHVEWKLDRNEFGLDFVEVFPDTMQRIVVADPGIKFTRLSSDIEVQKRLRHSLRNFLKEKNIKPVFIDEYKAACNEKYSEEILAPLFHYRTPPVSTGFHFLDWEGYHELNYAFLHTLVANYQPGDWILVFNYQLMLLPKLLRDNPVTQEANIGFYLATVFPSSEMYRILPQREDLLRGILASTFIGFHGFQYKRHFFTACTRVLGIECSGNRIEPHVDVGGCAGARVVTSPRGISPEPWLKKLQQPHIQARIANLRSKFGGRKVLMAIDTLDFTKGIPNKMLAYNKFLTEHPEWIDKVVFFQICVPKVSQQFACNSVFKQEHTGYQEASQFYHNERTAKIDYKEILAHLYQLAGAINANFGNITYQPVQFLLSSLTAEKIVCLYALADIVVITPLRESHSWAAYEFVLCQSYTNKGVLILSEFSGSSQSLGAAAICVNPWDPHALAAAIYDALVMKTEEKLARHEYAYNYILTYDAKAWGHNLMKEFREAISEIEAERRRIPKKLTCNSLAYIREKASTCILILGLRGALVASNSRGVDPQLIGKPKLPRRVEMALLLLSQDPNTHIVIISSSQVSVLSQIAAHFPEITLMAENGHFVRYGVHLRNAMATSSDEKGGLKTPTMRPDQEITDEGFISSVGSQLDLSWMEPVEEICRYFEERTPGCFLYRTETSVAWNYRGAQREHGVLQARDLLIHLWAGPTTLTAPTDIVVGPHSVEVRSSATNKTTSIEKWLHDLVKYLQVDFSQSTIICAANFLPRDEDVYSALYRISDTVGCQNYRKSNSNSINGEDKKVIESLDEKVRAKVQTTTDARTKFADRVVACTVGLKPSRADYYLADERDVEHFLTLLAAIAALQQWDFSEEKDALHMHEKKTNKDVKIRIEAQDEFESRQQYKWHRYGPLKNKKAAQLIQQNAFSARQKAMGILPDPVQMLTVIQNNTPLPLEPSETAAEVTQRSLDHNIVIRTPELQRTIITALYFYKMSSLASKKISAQRLHQRRLYHHVTDNTINKTPYIPQEESEHYRLRGWDKRIKLGRRSSTPANLNLNRDYSPTTQFDVETLKYELPEVLEDSDEVSVERCSDHRGNRDDDDDDDDDDEDDDEDDDDDDDDDGDDDGEDEEYDDVNDEEDDCDEEDDDNSSNVETDDDNSLANHIARTTRNMVVKKETAYTALVQLK